VKGRSWRWIADFLRGRKFSIVCLFVCLFY
jgi:hypothetical protein